MRFLLAHPATIKKIKNGSEIRILPSHVRPMAHKGPANRNVQVFTMKVSYLSL